MTARTIILFSVGYLLALGAATYFTRPTVRRLVGALAGGVVGGLVVVGAIALGEARGWWHVPLVPTPFFLSLLYVGSSISCAPVYLVTWRVVRRFGWRGLAASLAAAAVIGPPRDYFYAARFPAWMVFGPGVAPILADAAAYVAFVALGHAAMRLVAGPAAADPLVRRSASAASPAS